MKSMKEKGVPMTFEQLWHLRLQRLLREWLKYGRLVVSDHLALVAVIVVGFGGLYYRQLVVQLDTWSSEFVRTLLSVVLWLIWWNFLRLGRPILLVHASDSSYILPRLPQWRKQWLIGVGLGAIIPFMLMALLTGIFVPLVWRYFNEGSVAFIWLWVTLLIIKLSLSVHFLNRAGSYKGIVVSNDWLAALVSGLLVYSFWVPVFVRIIIWGSAILVVLVYVGRCYDHLWKQPLNVEGFVTLEEERQAAFYQWVAIFADVPQLKPPVKRRAYLDRVLHYLPGGDTIIGYYAMRLLWRDTAYSGIAWRIFCFTGILILGVNHPYFLMAAGILSVILTVIQYVPLYDLTQRSPMMFLYPTFQGKPATNFEYSSCDVQKQQIRSFQLVVSTLLMSQWLGYVCILLLKGNIALDQVVRIVLSWLAVSVLFIVLYLPWKCKKSYKN